MKTGQSGSINQANEILLSGDFREIVLDSDVSTDEFFKLADRWGDKGGESQQIREPVPV